MLSLLEKPVFPYFTSADYLLRTAVYDAKTPATIRIKRIGIHRQYKIRRCSECGKLLRVYEGVHDTIGSYVRYIQDNEVVCFAQHYSVVMTTYLRNKERLKDNGQTLTALQSSHHSQYRIWNSHRRTTTSSWTDPSRSRTVSSSDARQGHSPAEPPSDLGIVNRPFSSHIMSRTPRTTGY